MYKILSPNRSFYCMQNKCWLIFEISKDSDYFWVGISFLHNINYHNHHFISVWVVPYDQYRQQLMVFWHYMNICWHLALLSSHTYTHTKTRKKMLVLFLYVFQSLSLKPPLSHSLLFYNKTNLNRWERQILAGLCFLWHQRIFW